jgi:AcrR family transcriptional regulator
MEDIRRRVGASNGSLYHHAKSKQQLAAELYVQTLAEYIDGFIATLGTALLPRELVAAAVAYELDYAVTRPERARYLFDAVAQPEVLAYVVDEIAELNQRLVRHLTALALPHVAGGTIALLPPEIVVAIVLGPARLVARKWLTHRWTLDHGYVADVLGDAAWRAVRRSPDEGADSRPEIP